MTMTEPKTWERGDYCTVAGWDGIVFYFVSWARTWEPFTAFMPPCDPNEDDSCGNPGCEGHEVETDEGEWLDDPNFALVVMVGDDRKHKVDVADLTPLPEDEHVCSCGQRGCGW